MLGDMEYDVVYARRTPLCARNTTNALLTDSQMLPKAGSHENDAPGCAPSLLDYKSPTFPGDPGGRSLPKET